MNIHIDILIATIGRPTLDTAITAAIHQTYPHTRCVVIGDGSQPEARMIAAHYNNKVRYLETPEKLGRAGNGVKEFWYNHPDCAPFLRFLDDDDWMPPTSIAQHIIPMEDPDVVVAICKMWMMILDKGRVVKERSLSGKIAVGQVGNGSLLLRTSALKGLKYQDRLYSDFFWLKQILDRGKSVLVPYHLYWYNQQRLHGSSAVSERGRADINANHT